MKLVRAALHEFHVIRGIRHVRKIKAAHQRNLAEYKFNRSYWNKRVLNTLEIIKEYDDCIKKIRDEV